MNKALLKENRKHGDPIFPVSTYTIHCQPEEPLLDLHWHSELEFLMITKGEALLRVDRQDYLVREGEAIFVGSETLHSGSVANGSSCSFKAVVFHPDVFGSGSREFIQDPNIFKLVHGDLRAPAHLTADTEAGRQMLWLLEQLFDVHDNRLNGYELMTKGCLSMAMYHLLSLSEPVGGGIRPDLGSERLKTVIAYIGEHYTEQIRLKDLSDLVAMSEAYFCRFFKRVTMKSPVEYINLYRVRQAAHLLKHSHKKVMEIAMDVGFNNLSYFNSVFKQHFGCTPVAYRKRPE